MPERSVEVNQIVRIVLQRLQYALARVPDPRGIQSALMVVAVASGCGDVPVEPDESLSREAPTLLHDEPDGPNSGRSDTWLTDELLESWYGVTTDSEGNATGRNLTNNEVTGRIPAEVGKLRQLRRKNTSGPWSWSTISLLMNVLSRRTVI
ncbi:MAG: hypothetical protein OYK82_04015 [Gammaproteobacteria bacterium]|nr:hypothetical protein [Gammaproteobacteria bacterium]